MKSLILAILAIHLLSCSTEEPSTLQNDEVTNFGQLFPRNINSGIQEVDGDASLQIDDAYEHNLGDWTQMSAYVIQFGAPSSVGGKKIEVYVDGQSIEASFGELSTSNHRGAFARLVGSVQAQQTYSLIVYAKKEWGSKTLKVSVFEGRKNWSKTIKIGAPIKPTPSSEYRVSVNADSPMITASAYVSLKGSETVLIIDASVQSLSHDKLFVFRDSDVVQRTMQPFWTRETILKFATGNFNGWKNDTVRYLGRSNGRENFRMYVSNFDGRHGPIVQRSAYQLDYVIDPKIEIDGRMNTRKILGKTGSIQIVVGQ